MFKLNNIRVFIIFTILICTTCLMAFYTPTDLFSTSQDKIYQPSTEKSLAAFQTVLQVLKDPRCINCHPSGDQPRQGNDQHLHLFDVTRGENDEGGPVQKCQTCHRNENNAYTLIPGAPNWALAPQSMGWYGQSDVEIGRRLMNSETNGGRSPEELVHHMTHDSLVLWGWNPGSDRSPVSVPFDEFKTALNTWLEHGAIVE